MALGTVLVQERPDVADKPARRSRNDYTRACNLLLFEYVLVM